MTITSVAAFFNKTVWDFQLISQLISPHAFHAACHKKDISLRS
jgi:hypothetical protein